MAGWPAKKNAAFNMQFPIFDADGDLVSGAAGLDSEVSKDGGTFTDCTNEAVEIATASGMYRLVLTATEMDADEVAVITKTTTTGAKTAPNVIYTSARQIDDLATLAAVPSAGAIADAVWDEVMSGHAVAGSFGDLFRRVGLTYTVGAVNDASATTTDFNTDGFTEATDDHFNGHYLVFTSGALKGQGRRIRDYVGTGQDCLFDRPFTEAPADNDEFVIIGMPSGVEEFLLGRLADVEGNADSTIRRVLWGFAKLVNMVDASTTTVAIKKTDDVTNQFTQTATETPGANPITVLNTV